VKVLELFSGSKSFSTVAKSMGHEVFTVDWKKEFNPDYACDILEFDYSRVPWVPDLIWASPPCTTFSVASIGFHWNVDNTPKTEAAKIGVKIVEKTREIIAHYAPKYWYIENPCGKLRKLPVMKDIALRHKLTYCQYGDTRMKPTDIWTNDMRWNPRPACKNGMKCHESAPRGARTGTQGLKGAYVRSMVPEALCVEILNLNKAVS
jgi:site-specific DNA-cytosine methylase